MKNHKKRHLPRRSFIATASGALAALGLGSMLPTSAAAAKVVLTDNYHEGKVALITGSSRGIGAAIAKELAARGCKVMVNCVKNQDLAGAVVRDIKAAGGQAHWMQADVRKPDKVRELFEFTETQLGPVNFVI